MIAPLQFQRAGVWKRAPFGRSKSRQKVLFGEIFVRAFFLEFEILYKMQEIVWKEATIPLFQDLLFTKMRNDKRDVELPSVNGD